MISLFLWLQASEAFWPHNLDGWLRVVATVVIALVGSWGIIKAELKRTIETERALTDNAVALLRRERVDAMELEQQERKLADKRLDERDIDLAQKLHVWMGKFDILAERIHEDRLSTAAEIASLRLELVAGFGQMRDMLHNCPYREDHPPRGES